MMVFSSIGDATDMVFWDYGQLVFSDQIFLNYSQGPLALQVTLAIL